MTRSIPPYALLLAVLAGCGAPPSPPRPLTEHPLRSASAPTPASASGSAAPHAPGEHATVTGVPAPLLPWIERRCLDLAWSPNSKNVAALGTRAYLLDADTLQPRAVVGFARGTEGAVRWSPDGNVIATADYRVSLWDARTGARLRYLEESYGVTLIDWRGRALAGVISPDALAAWDAETGKKRWTRALPKGGMVRAIAISPDEERVALEVGFKELGVWRMADGSPVWSRTPGARGLVLDLVFSPDGKLLATSDVRERTITLWDATREAEPLRVIRRSCPGGGPGLAFQPDGKRLATPCGDKLELWTAATGELDAEVPLGSPGVGSFGTKLAWSPDGRRIAIGGEGGVRVVTLETRRVVAAPTVEMKKRTWQGSAAWSLDGRTLYDLRTAVRWDGSTGRGRRFGPPGSHMYRLALHPREPLAALFATVGDPRAAAPSAPERLLLWDLGQDRARAELSLGPYYIVRSLAFDASGSVLVAEARTDAEQALLSWDGNTGTPRGKTEPIGEFQAASLSGDGRLLAFREWGPKGDSLRILDLRRGKVQLSRKLEPGGQAMSPDGRTVAIGQPTGVLLLDVASGRVVGELEWPATERRPGPAPEVFVLGWSRDASTVAARREAEIVLWDTASKALGTTLRLTDGADSRTEGDAVLSADFGFVAMPAVDGTRVVRIADGASVLLVALEQAGELRDLVLSDGGLVDGDERGLAALVFRVGDAPLSAALVPFKDVASAVRHPGLLGEYLAGKALPRASVTTAELGR